MLTWSDVINFSILTDNCANMVEWDQIKWKSVGPLTRQGGTRAQCLVQGDGLVTHGHNAMACCSTERDLDDAYWCSNNNVNIDGMPKAWHKGTMPCAQRWGVMGAMPWLVAAPRDGLARAWCHNGNTNGCKSMLPRHGCYPDVQTKRGLGMHMSCKQQQHEELDSKQDCKLGMSRSLDSCWKCCLSRTRIACP